MPDKDSPRATWPGASWVRVNGEFVTVQTLPTVLFAQPAIVPAPAKMLVRLKVTSDVPPVNMAKPGMSTGPDTGPPGLLRVCNVTWFVPANDPEFGPVTTKFEKVTLVPVTLTVPAILATLGSIKLVADAAEVNRREPTPISPKSEILRTTFPFLCDGKLRF